MTKEELVAMLDDCELTADDNGHIADRILAALEKERAKEVMVIHDMQMGGVRGSLIFREEGK